MLDITASIVLFKSDPEIVGKAIDSFLNTRLNVKLYLIDNSPTDSLRTLKADDRCVYIFNNKNLGFGKAHNIAIRLSLEEAKYHVVLNPDIVFEQGVLEAILVYMDVNQKVGQVMPKVIYPNGDIQYLCKLLPTPLDLILRRFLGFLPSSKKRDILYELRDSGYNRIMNIPYLSGCFMFFRTSALRSVGMFDERIFMYIEDADLTRRMHQKFMTNYLPDVVICHNYEKGSYKNFKLMLYNMHGAFVYFSKWGWIFDKERRRINTKVISDYIETKN